MSRILVPDYDAKITADRASEAKWDATQGPWAESEGAFRTSVVAHCRSDLGLPGRDFLAVVVEVQEGQCVSCHKVVCGVVDLVGKMYVGALEDAGTNGRLALSGLPGVMTFEYDDPGCSATACSHYVLKASIKSRAAGQVSVAFDRPVGTRAK